MGNGRDCVAVTVGGGGMGYGGVGVLWQEGIARGRLRTSISFILPGHRG